MPTGDERARLSAGIFSPDVTRKGLFNTARSLNQVDQDILDLMSSDMGRHGELQPGTKELMSDSIRARVNAEIFQGLAPLGETQFSMRDNISIDRGTQRQPHIEEPRIPQWLQDIFDEERRQQEQEDLRQKHIPSERFA